MIAGHECKVETVGIEKDAPRRRILVVKSFAPYPLDCGSNVLTHNLLRELGKEFAVTLLTCRPPEETAVRKALQEFCERVIFCDPPNTRGVVTRLLYAGSLRLLAASRGTPLAALYASLAFRKPLERLLKDERYDLIQIEYWNHAELGACCSRAVPRCLFLHDVQPLAMERESAFVSSAQPARALRRAAKKVAAFEASEMRHFSHVLTVTESDAAVYRRKFEGHCRVTHVPTLYDVPAQPLRDPGGATLVFVGAMGHHPNTDAMRYFVRDVLPIVRKDAPQVELVIAGRNPPAEIRGLATKGVVVTGSVPDIRPYLEKATVFVAPLRFGSGVKIKILEALALGKPVVTTSIGVEGIEVENGVHCLVADNAREFANCIVGLLQSPDVRRRLGLAGQERIRDRHGPDAAGPRVRSVYRQIMNDGSLS